MKTSTKITSVFIGLAMAFMSVSVQAQRQSSRAYDRQVAVIVQRLERSSSRFRTSLSNELINSQIDQTRAQNDINNFMPDFENAVAQFKAQLSRRRAGGMDAQNVLEKASVVNGFMTRNRLSRQVQNDWAAVRNDLNALANAYGVSWQWDRQSLPPIISQSSATLSNNELTQLIRRIETGGESFRLSLTDAFGETGYDRTTREGNMNNAVQAFLRATDQLRAQFDIGQPITTQVAQVIARATPIDTYMRNNVLTQRVQSDWSALGLDINSLASAFNLSANLAGGSSPQSGFAANSLTGTFRLDSARSDNAREKAQQATRNVSNMERQDVYERTLARLESPEMLSIDRRGTTVTIASSLASRVTFEADGRERQEQIANGQSTRVIAKLQGEQLVVSSNGYRENDFSVTFEPIENGRSLRVRRQIDSDRLTQPITVESIYERTSDVAQWNVYNGSPILGENAGSTRGEFIVRDGESVVAILDNDLTTKQTKGGEKFTLTVKEPGQFEGAVIEGTVSNVEQGGRITGRAGMSLTFETIRLRNGQNYKFAGTLDKVRTLNSDNVTVDNEGTAEGDNQTPQTVQRAGVGTAIGAIIGAIAGGAKGAVIGAVVGAVGGAGSVYIQGKESLDLPRGTELTIRANAPR